MVITIESKNRNQPSMKWYISCIVFNVWHQLILDTSLKMNILKKLQEVSAAKPYRGFSKLAIGYHEIVGIRTVKSKFSKSDSDEAGKSILVELKNEILFLPQYFSSCLDEKDMDELSSSKVEDMYLYFGGRRNQSK